MELRKGVRAFAELMETKLRKYDKTRGVSWKNCDHGYLLHRMIEEVGEVVAEIAPNDVIGRWLCQQLEDHYVDHMLPEFPKHPGKLSLELADVGNIAMMLADVTDDDFCDDDAEDKIECALTREQWNDLLSLRGVVIGTDGAEALLALGRALDATWNTDHWPDNLNE